MSASATWTAKAPILFLYIQLFGIKRRLKGPCYVTLVFTFLYLLGWNIWLLVKNVPREDGITTGFLMDSTYSGSVAGVASGALGVATDVVIFVLPLPVIAGLHLPLRQKIGLFIVFFTGLL